MYILLLFFTWLLLCLVVGYLAAERGRDVGGFFFLSLCLSPLVGYAVLVALPQLDRPQKVQSMPARIGSWAERNEYGKAEWLTLLGVGIVFASVFATILILASISK